MTNCPRCQSLLPDPPERFCPSCGADLTLLPPPVPPGAYQEHSCGVAPSSAEPGMKYGPIRHSLARCSAAALISGV